MTEASSFLIPFFVISHVRTTYHHVSLLGNRTGQSQLQICLSTTGPCFYLDVLSDSSFPGQESAVLSILICVAVCHGR